jgi:hypothetical protein
MNTISAAVCARMLLMSWALLLSAQAAERSFTGDDTDFANPDRGLFVPIDPWGLSNRWLQTSDLSGLRDQGISLVRRIYTLREWRDSALPASFLADFSDECALLRSAGMRMVLRFSYNWTSEDGTQDLSSRPDASRARIEAHLTQLQGVLAANVDVISHLQAGFVGHYGEWHASTNGLINNTTLAMNSDGAAVQAAILAAVPVERMVCVLTRTGISASSGQRPCRRLRPSRAAIALVWAFTTTPSVGTIAGTLVVFTTTPRAPLWPQRVATSSWVAKWRRSITT